MEVPCNDPGSAGRYTKQRCGRKDGARRRKRWEAGREIRGHLFARDVHHLGSNHLGLVGAHRPGATNVLARGTRHHSPGGGRAKAPCGHVSCTGQARGHSGASSAPEEDSCPGHHRKDRSIVPRGVSAFYKSFKPEWSNLTMIVSPDFPKIRGGGVPASFPLCAWPLGQCRGNSVQPRPQK